MIDIHCISRSFPNMIQYETLTSGRRFIHFGFLYRGAKDTWFVNKCVLCHNEKFIMRKNNFQKVKIVKYIYKFTSPQNTNVTDCLLLSFQ